MSTPNHMLEEEAYNRERIPLPGFQIFNSPLDEEMIADCWNLPPVLEEMPCHHYQTLKPVPPEEIFEKNIHLGYNSFHWLQRSPGEWDSKDVMEWIYNTAREHELDSVSGENFKNINGRQLMLMGQKDFLSRDGKWGSFLHQQLQTLFERCQTFQVCCSSPTSSADIYAEDPFVFGLYQDEYLDQYVLLNRNIDPLMSALPADGRGSPVIPMSVLDQSISSDEHMLMTCSDNMKPVDLTIKVHVTAKPKRRRRKTSDSSQASSNASSNASSQASSKENQPVKRPRGRKPGQVSKAGNHLWEFIRDLLHDTRYNPKIIKWEDRDQGIFRIIKSSEVSSLWGKKKNNSNMTYEKLSRALRFCRSERYFAEVPKDGTFAKKLVFKFGEKAQDWKLEQALKKDQY